MKGNVVYISLLKNGIPLPRNTYSRTLEPLITFIELLCRPRPYSSIGPYHCQSISNATAAGLRQTSRRNQPIYRGTMGQHDSIVSRRLCIHSLPPSSRSENAFFPLPFLPNIGRHASSSRTNFRVSFFTKKLFESLICGSIIVKLMEICVWIRNTFQ